MKEKESTEISNWFLDLIEAFRNSYQTLPEHTQRYVWNVENFNAPCQILSLTFAIPKITFLWVTKDKNKPDKDVRSYGPLLADQLIDTAQEILSDSDLYKEFGSNEKKFTNIESYGNYLEEQFLWIVDIIKNQPLMPFSNLGKPSVGMKASTFFYDGFSWIINGDITAGTPDKIIRDIIEGAKKREDDDKNPKNQKSETSQIKEELVNGFSTYFYPPVWLGEFPKFDFKSRVNGIFIFPTPTYLTSYKEIIISLNQKGLFFIGESDKPKCMQFMNEIIGAAILLDLDIDTVSEDDVGETTVTKDKGEIRSQSYPRSLTRYWQAEQDNNAVNYSMLQTYRQAKVDKIIDIIKVAEKATISQETSSYIVFYAYANQHLKNKGYMEAFLFDWLIIERYVRKIWDEYLQSKNISGNRKRKLKHWSIDHVLETLSFEDKLDQKLYEDVLHIKNKRNDLNHEGYNPTKTDAEKCHQLSEDIIRGITGIKKPYY